MKTDAQVLTEAITMLEAEGAWCQGAYYRYDSRQAVENGWVEDGLPVDTADTVYQVLYADDLVVIGQCAEGAIRRAAGYEWSGSHPGTVRLDPQVFAVHHQCRNIESQVAEKIKQLCPAVHSTVVQEWAEMRLDEIALEASIEGRPFDRRAEREALVAHLDRVGFALHAYNDADNITAADVILAMKHVREELS